MTERVPQARLLRVAGGRRIAFRCYGDVVGRPLFYLHGVGGNGVAPHLTDWATELGLAIAAPDRPGYGQSSPWRRRRLADIAEDLEAIADDLGWSRFAVVGVSGGGPYAVAAAWALPHRVSRAVVVSGVGPPDSPGCGFHPERRPRPTDVATGGYWRTLARVLPQQAATVARARRAEQVVAAMAATPDLPPADRAAVARDDVAEALAAVLATARLRDARGLAAEMQLLVRDWDVALHEITVPVDLWIGNEDRAVSVEASGWLARRIPGATLTEVEAAGHAMAFTHWRRFLGPIAAACD